MKANEKSIQNKVMPHTLKILNGLWAIPFVLFIRLLKPIHLIKFSVLRSNRLGDWVLDTAQLKLTPEKKIHRLVWFKEPCSNSFWAKIVKRNLKISQWAESPYYWNWKIPGGDEHNEVFLKDRDTEGLMEKDNSKLRFSFSEEENVNANSWLKSKGWSEGQPFVCIIVRDSAYLKSSNLVEKIDWSYHSYRDTNINDYLPAMEWLTDQGIYVFRMGKVMEKPLVTKNKKIIDYAFLEDKSDFLDIWLFANCNLCISTGTGPDFVSDFWRRPLLYLNYIPIGNAVSWSNSMSIPKNLYWKKSGKELSLKEHLKFTSYHNIENSPDIGQRDLSKEEILVSVKECWKFLSGSSKLTDEEKILNKKFWKIIKTQPEYRNQHRWIHPLARVGMSWLKNKEATFLR